MLESKLLQTAPPPLSAAAPVIAVRWASIADRAAIVKVLQRAFADYDGMQPPPGALGETEASVRAHLKRGGRVALAYIEGAPVGALFAERKGDALFLSRVSVVPEKRGSGITARMVALAEELARAEGVRALTLRVREVLAQNLALFERLGFRETGRHGHESRPETVMIDMRKGLAD